MSERLDQARQFLAAEAAGRDPYGLARANRLTDWVVVQECRLAHLAPNHPARKASHYAAIRANNAAWDAFWQRAADRYVMRLVARYGEGALA